MWIYSTMTVTMMAISLSSTRQQQSSRPTSQAFIFWGQSTTLLQACMRRAWDWKFFTLFWVWTIVIRLLTSNGALNWRRLVSPLRPRRLNNDIFVTIALWFLFCINKHFPFQIHVHTEYVHERHMCNLSVFGEIESSHKWAGWKSSKKDSLVVY